MTYRDPYSGHQTAFHRTDPTGRWSPLVERKEHSAWPILGGFVFGIIIVAMFAVTL